jgi:hypothetical protein
MTKPLNDPLDAPGASDQVYGDERDANESGFEDRHQAAP